MTLEEKRAYQREWARKYRETHKEEIKAINQRYREKHKEDIKEANKQYREKNRDKINAQMREYRKNNPDIIARINIRYWEKQSGLLNQDNV